MPLISLSNAFEQQQFANGYELIDGVQMHEEQGSRFQIVNRWFKKYIDSGHFVEVRVDSPRFSAHPDAPMNCTCPHCDEEATKPILGHTHPASLVAIPPQEVPSRGWGEDFWVRVESREDEYLCGIVDNPLYENRLHEIAEGDRIYFHTNHILSVHGLHNMEIVERMTSEDLVLFRAWLDSHRDSKS
jgi:hypothetical protein